MGNITQLQAEKLGLNLLGNALASEQVRKRFSDFVTLSCPHRMLDSLCHLQQMTDVQLSIK